MKNAIKPLAKSVLIPLGLTASASAADAGIHKKIFGSKTTTLIVSNDEMEGINKTVKSLENCGLLLNGVSEIIKNEAKEQKGGFHSMLLGILGYISLLGNILARIGINRVGETFTRACYGSSIFNTTSSFNLEIENEQNEPRFSGVYSRDNLPDKIKDGA